MTRLPNFLHLGPGKSGSSWLHETLTLHPEVYLSEAKDLYFFSRYYDRGVDWYRKQFRSAQPSDRIVGTYRCDAGLGACVPGDTPHVSMGIDSPVVLFCGPF